MADFAAVQAAGAALFRRRQLQRGGAPARTARAGAGLPAARPSGVRPRAARACAALAMSAPRRRRARDALLDAHRSRDRAVRHRRPARSQPARLVSGAGPDILVGRRPSWARRRPRSTACSSAAAWRPRPPSSAKSGNTEGVRYERTSSAGQPGEDSYGTRTGCSRTRASSIACSRTAGRSSATRRRSGAPNQKKLDRVLKNQAKILANQGKILAK